MKLANLTHIDVDQSPLQFSVLIPDTSVAVKTELRSSKDILIHFRLNVRYT